MKTRLEALDFQAGGQKLAGTLLAPAAVLPGILFVHGWGGSQEQDLERARQAAGIGCICLTFDLRGHEGTLDQRDTVTREENLQDLVAAYDLLLARPGVDRASIAVIGISYGGYLASILTAQRPVRWLALRAPALYPDPGWELAKRALNQDAGLMDYRKRKLSPRDNRALAACARFSGDVLIVESENDALVPHAVIDNYVTAFAGARSLTARVIAGADHALTDRKQQEGYTSLLLKWLTEMIVGARENEADQRVAQGAPARTAKPVSKDEADESIASDQTAKETDNTPAATTESGIILEPSSASARTGKAARAPVERPARTAEKGRR